MCYSWLPGPSKKCEYVALLAAMVTCFVVTKIIRLTWDISWRNQKGFHKKGYPWWRRFLKNCFGNCCTKCPRVTEVWPSHGYLACGKSLWPCSENLGMACAMVLPRSARLRHGKKDDKWRRRRRRRRMKHKKKTVWRTAGEEWGRKRVEWRETRQRSLGGQNKWIFSNFAFKFHRCGCYVLCLLMSVFRGGRWRNASAGRWIPTEFPTKHYECVCF